MSKSTKEIVSVFYEALNSKGNPSLIMEALSANWKLNPEPPGEGSHLVRYGQSTAPIWKALPDFKIDVEQILVNDNYAAVRSIVSGTHADVFFGIPATGKKISILAHDFHRIENGKIVESWHIEDWLSAFFQLGWNPTH